MKHYKPGRELDAVIAEKAMGWASIRQTPDGEWIGLEPTGDGEHVYPFAAVRYCSTDVAAAIRALDAFADRYRCQVQVTRLHPAFVPPRSRYLCTISGGALIYPTAALELSAGADTIEYAICLAIAATEPQETGK